VILDELGYLPFSASGGALLFHLLSKLYERTSVVITVVLRMLWKLPISGLLAWDVGSGQAATSRDIGRSD
jgi:DNA replication protein DnaC